MAGLPVYPAISDELPNFPEGIARALQQLTDHMNQRFNQMEQRIDEVFGDLQQAVDASERARKAMVANRIPIQQNKGRAYTDAELVPLRSHLTNQIPAGFPERISDVTSMAATTVDRLLEAYEQSTDGDLAERRRRLKRTFGARVPAV